MIFDVQKASILKRASAFLLDIILLAVLATGFMIPISAITEYDNQGKQLLDKYTYYEEKYNIELFKAEYTPEEEARLNEAYAEMKEDTTYIKLSGMVPSLTIMILSVGVFLSYAVLEFMVPLLLKNGMTIGKKIFGIAVIRIDGVKLAPMALFIRTFIGKYVVETMIPALIVLMFFWGRATLITLAVLVLLPVFELIILIATKNNYLVHDVFSGSVAVDMATQMIFNSQEDLLEYKKKIAEERASQASY